MVSLVKVWRSLPMTTPVPAVPPPVRAAVMVVEKPSAAHAGDELETERSAAVPVCSVIAPLAAMVGATPVIVPIFPSKVPTVSVTLSWFPTAPAATKVSVVPSTTMVSPATKFVVNESLGDGPDSAVAFVIGAGVAALFCAAEPVVVASPKGTAGVPTGKGFWLKSEGFKPPAANSVPAVAVVLAAVVGVVGRFAAY